MASSKQYFDVLVRVSQATLPTLLSAIAPECTLISVQPSAAASPPAVEHEHTVRYANGKRNKGIDGADLAIEVLSREARPFSLDELRNAFVAQGFAPASASPVMSALCEAGKVRSLGRGLYVLPGTTIKMGATS